MPVKETPVMVMGFASPAFLSTRAAVYPVVSTSSESLRTFLAIVAPENDTATSSEPSYSRSVPVTPVMVVVLF